MASLKRRSIRPLRIGLIGCGNFGVVLARQAASTREFKVVAGYDRTPSVSRRAASELGFEPCASIKELVAREDLDAAFVAPSHATHRYPTVLAALAGKHVFCEKPMAISTHECRTMIEVARKHRVHLVIGHVERHLPTVAHVRKVVSSGGLGAPIAVRAVRSNDVERL